MNALESLDGFSRWWGNWMLQMAWQVGLLVLILTAMTWIWRQKSAVLLHTLWLLVLVRLVLPPGFAFPTGWAFWLLPAAGQSHAASIEPPAQTTTVKPSPLDTATPASHGTESASVPVELADHPESLVARESSALERESSPATGAPASPALTLPSRPMQSWSSYLLLAWAGVAGTLLGLLFWGSVRIRRWVREAEPIDDPELYSLLEDCRERLGIKHLVELRDSETCTTPVVVGFRRPVILLPREVLARLNAAEMRAVLMHELNHIARGDAIVNLLQGVLGALYFFHPLVWWANASLRRLREEACDELTVAALDGERRTYGEALVKVTEIFGYASPPLALGVLESKNPARARLGRILDPQLPQGAIWSWRTATALLLLAAVLLPGAGGRTNAGPLPVEVGQSSENKSGEAEKTTAGEPPAKSDPVADVPASGVTSSGSKVSAASPAGNGRAVENSEPNAAPAQTAAALSPMDGKGPLSYRWQAGKSYAYSIQIEAEEEETTEIYSGTPTYLARSTGKDGTELVFNGRLMQSQKLKPSLQIPFGRPPWIRGPFSSFSGVGIQTFPGAEQVLHVNNQGHLQSMQGDSQLPYVLGNLSQLVLVSFPEDARAQWEESEKTAILLKAGNDGRFPFPRAAFGPFANRDAGERLEARERSEYRRDEPGDNAVVIHRNYQLKTTPAQGGQPRLLLTGDVQFSFDLVLGLSTSVAGQFKLSQNTENTAYTIPITLSAKLLSEGERTKHEAEVKEAAHRHPLEAQALDAALADLTAVEPDRVQSAANRLERAEPQGRREEVSRALDPLLKSRDNFTRQAGARALAVWCTEESVPMLIQALDDEFFTVPLAALEGLGNLKDKRAVEPIARLLRAKKHRLQAVQALAALGNVAEDAALELLGESDSDMRYDACKVLKAVGGRKSIERLAKSGRDDANGIIRLVANEAVDEIRRREE
jgi:beta-lactamase regulating signal transducer with metallopeptidase domain